VTELAPNPRLPSLRNHERVAVEAEVTLRRSGKLNFRVRVYDISPEGCRAEFVERPELYERVWIRFEGMHSLEATICWIAGSKTGMRFVQPIHSAVFQHLANRMQLNAGVK
jgi:hypothetical protein